MLNLIVLDRLPHIYYFPCNMHTYQKIGTCWCNNNDKSILQKKHFYAYTQWLSCLLEFFCYHNHHHHLIMFNLTLSFCLFIRLIIHSEYGFSFLSTTNTLLVVQLVVITLIMILPTVSSSYILLYAYHFSSFIKCKNIPGHNIFILKFPFFVYRFFSLQKNNTQATDSWKSISCSLKKYFIPNSVYSQF